MLGSLWGVVEETLEDGCADGLPSEAERRGWELSWNTVPWITTEIGFVSSFGLTSYATCFAGFPFFQRFLCIATILKKNSER